jgi:AsmA family protein
VTIKARKITVPRWAWRTGGVFGLLAVGLVLFALFFNWNLLRGPIADEASRISHRPVRIDGDLKVHLLSWTPSASAGQVFVGNPAWTHGGRLAEIGQLDVSIKLLPLLVGRIDLPLLGLHQADISLLRDAGGQENWRTNPANKAPFKLPPIEHFVMPDGHVRLVDLKKNMVLTGQVQTRETNVGAAHPAGAFELLGEGTVNHDRFSLHLTGGPLINVRRDRPYPFDADMHAGATHVVAHGVLPKPFDFGQVDTALTVTGDNFASLADLTSLALPETPPYSLSGRFVREGKIYHFSDVTGRVGESDLEGRFMVDDSTDRPNLKADLRSRRLNYKDLGSLVGAPPPSARVTPLQIAEAARLQAENRILPDATLNVDRVRKMDAHVRYSADAVTAPDNLPLRQVKLTLILDHGVMSFDPISFVLPQGELSGKIRIDARGAVPRSDIDLKVINVHLENFFKNPGQAPLEGVFEARAVLHGVGDSVHKAASNADGTVTVVVPHGQIRQAFAELMGINVANGVGLLFSKDQRETGIRCAVADFHATHGVLQAHTFVVDTDVVAAFGQGDINLGDESLNLTIRGHPKKLRLFHLNAPIAMTGHLKSPKFGVKPSGAAIQLAGAAALGVALGPVAAVLPFVDVGLNHDADCVSLVSQAQQKGAPVSPASTTPTKKK